MYLLIETSGWSHKKPYVGQFGPVDTTSGSPALLGRATKLKRPYQCSALVNGQALFSKNLLPILIIHTLDQSSV